MGRDLPTKVPASSRRQHRLPVNQRRHKVAPENRKRVSTACNSCNIRRIKCTGEHPCQPCRNSSRVCEYPEAVEKISVPRSQWDELVAKCARLERCLEQAVPDETQRRNLLGRINASSSEWEPEIAQSNCPSSLASPSPKQAPRDSSSPSPAHLGDENGSARCLGPTSGAAFLGHIKDLMTDFFASGWTGDYPSDTMTLLNSVGRCQTHHSRSLKLLHEEAGSMSDRAICELRMEHNQLVILTTRPTFINVVKKAVAARIDHRPWHWQNSPQYSYSWQCLDAARENLRLARWTRNLPSTRKKLLAPFLHNLFHAAVIVLLHELIAEPADIDDDATDVLFAIECFDSESRGESISSRSTNFLGESARILRDMTTLVRRMLHSNFWDAMTTAAAAQSGSIPQRNTSVPQAPPSTAIYDVGFILNPEIPPEAPAPAPAHPSATTSSHALFTELSSWMSNDEHHVYDGYSTL